MVAYQSAYNRDLMWQVQTSAAGYYNTPLCMAMALGMSPTPATANIGYYSTGGFFGTPTPGFLDEMIISGSLGAPADNTTNCTTVHTVGSSSFTVSKTWTSDQIVAITKVGLYGGAYASIFGGATIYSLAYVQNLATPLQLAVGDTFTFTFTITL